MIVFIFLWIAFEEVWFLKIWEYYSKNKLYEIKKLMKSYGYIMGTKVISNFRIGKFIKLKDIVEEKQEKNRDIAYEVSTNNYE